MNVRSIDTLVCVSNIDEEAGLQAELFITIGCRVMLTNNTWVKEGLANGTTGFVCAIIFNKNKTSSESSNFIIVQFAHYSGPCINGKLFPVATNH